MKDRVETIIRDWLNETFKNPDALPKPVLSGLAEEISKHKYEFHRDVQDEYDMEDIEYAAEEREGVVLTEDEKLRALHRYQKTKESDLETLSYIVDEILDEREEK